MINLPYSNRISVFALQDDLKLGLAISTNKTLRYSQRHKLRVPRYLLKI